MKRIKIILGIALVFLAVLAHGQEIAFGLRGGLNLSALKLNDPQASYDSKTGYHAGIFFRSKAEKVAFQPELLLFTQNGDIKSTLFGTAQESFTYLSVPVLLKFYPIGGLNIQAGPQFGFLLDGERKYESFFGGGTEDIKEYYKDSDVSISFGGGYDFPFGLSADIRYNLGVKDINNVANGDPAKSQVFLVGIGWNFLRK